MKKSRLLNTICIGFLCFAVSANASYIYTYTGNNLDLIVNDFGLAPDTLQISGWLELETPLLPNQQNISVAPTTFSFTDGDITMTESNTGYNYGYNNFWYFLFTTDETGSIIGWNVTMQIGTYDHVYINVGPLNYTGLETRYLSTTNDPADFGIYDVVSSDACTEPLEFCSVSWTNWVGYNHDYPGTWTVSQVPIPPSVWLFGSGLLGLVGIARKKAA